MMINNVAELIDELKKNGGKIHLQSSYTISINNVTIDNTEESDIKMIYADLDMLDSEDAIIEFCDSFGMIVLTVREMDLFDFEILFELDENGRIKD